MTTTTMNTRIAAAVKAQNGISAALQRNAAAQAQARALVQPAAALADTAQALEQQKVSLIARFLRAGRKPEQKELKEVEDKISAAQAGSQSVGAMLQAQAVVLAELEQEAAELRVDLVGAAREVRIARHEATGEELAALLVEVERAADVLRHAYAGFIGAGRAHALNAQALRSEYPGESFGSSGSLLQPAHTFLAVPGTINGIRLDSPEAAAAATAEALRRWKV
jgi:chromosome segregation ATPase